MSADLQDEAGVPNAELVVCLTNNDQTNILSAVLAKSLGAKTVGVLINEVSMQALREELSLDMVIDPRGSTISSVLRHVRRGRIIDVFELQGGGAEVMEGEVLETSPLAGKPISFAEDEDGIAIGAIVRGKDIFDPKPDMIVKPGDRLVLLAESSALEDVEQLFRVSMDYF
jgi:trk system potassium uptake protein TrkA